jgi:serine/threonine protein phosphatase PrpC
MINSAVIKPQFNNSNNNSKIYISNDSNTHLNLNIYSSRSLNNNKNFLKDNNNSNNTNSLLNETFNINKITSEFKGKKIKCIHDISKTGLSGDEKKVNQDRDFIFHNFVSGFENIFMGVCDGHGFFGHEISEFIKENLPMDLNRIIKSKKLDLNKDDLSKVLIETFKMENESLKRYKQIDSDLSGSTCVSVIYTPKKLIIANLGDSRCVLGTKNKNEWKYINLSRDHKPDIKEEADRIKKKGVRIRPMIDEDGNFVGPMRVYMKDKDMPGLAMTRSFGDNFASIAGTICEPEIKEHILVPEDKFIVLASDGLFEFISSEEVGNIVKGYYEKDDIVGCCEYLYKESTRKWIQEEEDTIDDITIILVFFEDLYYEVE